ncbi:hypothetical protein FHX52_1511 [Humibacillus xanthopallidus]|uniref:Uncharacterized protein n=1 Tax=Humibacillus xanthopallidus TaxID=412689 RepID=A0A543PWH1_9MICO|nr:hypothetical protein [Humibacillus xanthopallidus]TQN48380.1 hypothetical protein FHX52_1511 [Humibacillus xanthopallidus]
MTQTPRSVENSHGGFVRGRGARVAGGALAAGAALALLAGVGAAGAAPPTTAHSPHKSYVCKYVSKPGKAERLQTGQNPIWVDNHSLLGYDGTVTVGQQFKDGQFRSVVIVANTPKLHPEPSVSDCPPATPPPTTTPPVTKTTTPPVTTTTTPPVTHSTPPATGSTPSATTPAAVPSTYPLQPVKAGVDSDVSTTQLGVTPLQALLVLLTLVGLLIALGVRPPRVIRSGSGDRDA